MSALPVAAPDFADWLAIANLKARYCRLLDTKDWAAFERLFTEDFLLDATASGGPRLEGRSVAIASVHASIHAARTAHQVHFPEIAIEGDDATGIWPMQDHLIWPDGRVMTGHGHYHECYRRTTDGWRIARSRLTRLMIDMRQPTQAI